MSGEIIHTVFISSTYEDLREERAEVQRALLKLHSLPIGMELFGSADEETWDFIKRQVAGCDYYVVIIAGRYGSTATDGLSYTEKEYDYAREIGKPILAFIRGDRGNIPSKNTESDPDKRERLDTFIKKAERSPVSYFSTPHELAGYVITSYVSLREIRPAIGFIRADQAPDLKKYVDLLEEKSRLERELAALKNSATALFPDASESITLTIRVESKQPTTQTRDGDSEIRNNLKEEKRQASITWGKLFVFVAENILLGYKDEIIIQKALTAELAGPTTAEQHAKIDEEVSQLSRIKLRLFGWGLIAFGTETEEFGTVQFKRQCWNLTDYGQKQYGLLMP